jgi:hypothetical protein
MAAAGTERPRVIGGEAFAKALADAGIIRDLDKVSRVVIDARAGHVVVLYVERYGDERLLKVAQSLDGIEVSSAPAEGRAEDGR